MRLPKAVFQNCSGLLPGHDFLQPTTHVCHLTVPVAVALLSQEAELREAGTGQKLTVFDFTPGKLTLPVVRIVLRHDRVVPGGILSCNVSFEPHRALRMENEQEYPDEHIEYWGTADFLPCPECGKPLCWYEAGFVPGYRVCTGREHHHCLLT
jgi:hypothetical protein